MIIAGGSAIPRVIDFAKFRNCWRSWRYPNGRYGTHRGPSRQVLKFLAHYRYVLMLLQQQRNANTSGSTRRKAIFTNHEDSQQKDQLLQCSRPSRWPTNARYRG